MTIVEEILASVDRGEDPALAKLIDNRVSERGVTRLEALRSLMTREEG